MVFVLLLVAHIFGDFIFQSSQMAQEKFASNKVFLLHCGIYSCLMLFVLIIFCPINVSIYFFITIAGTHLLIDYSRIKILSKFDNSKPINKSKDFFIFFVDQMLHFVVILICACFAKELSGIGKIINEFINKQFNLNFYNILIYIFLYVICLGPAAIFIKKVFVLTSIQNDVVKEGEVELIKSGQLIGMLERTIILTLGLNGQLGAIGFVLAAKSLARFKQLEDREFAEKYLVGTLLSVTIALFFVVIGNYMLIK